MSFTVRGLTLDGRAEVEVSWFAPSERWRARRNREGLVGDEQIVWAVILAEAERRAFRRRRRDHSSRPTSPTRDGCCLQYPTTSGQASTRSRETCRRSTSIQFYFPPAPGDSAASRAELTVLARLSLALARARAVPLVAWPHTFQYLSARRRIGMLLTKGSRCRPGFGSSSSSSLCWPSLATLAGDASAGSRPRLSVVSLVVSLKPPSSGPKPRREATRPACRTSLAVLSIVVSPSRRGARCRARRDSTPGVPAAAPRRSAG
jgi:hypothetical protein